MSTLKVTPNPKEHILQWTIPDFSHFLVAKEGDQKELTSLIDSPNIAAVKPEFPGVIGRWKTKQFRLIVKSTLEPNDVLRILISGEILLDGPEKLKFSEVKFNYGKMRFRKGPVVPVVDPETKLTKNCFNLKSFKLSVAKPFPYKNFANLEVVLFLPDKIQNPRNGFGELVMSKLQGFYELQKLTDLTLLVGDEELQVHRSIIAASSEVMEKKFSDEEVKKSGRYEIPKNVDMETLKVVVDFCYGIPVQERLEILADKIHHAAKIFGLKDLEEACHPVLGGKLTLMNAVGHFIYAKEKGSNELAEKTVEFVNQHQVAFAEAGGFAEMVEKAGKEVSAEFFVRLTKKATAFVKHREEQVVSDEN